MSYGLTIAPLGQSIEIEGGQTILYAALCIERLVNLLANSHSVPKAASGGKLKRPFAPTFKIAKAAVQFSILIFQPGWQVCSGSCHWSLNVCDSNEPEEAILHFSFS